MIDSTLSQTTLAERLKWARNEANFSQSSIASVIGVTKAAISQIETGLTKNLNDVSVFLIADALGVSARWLATGIGLPDDVSKDSLITANQKVGKLANYLAALPQERIDALAIVLGIKLSD